jgi:hypothetical protein
MTNGFMERSERLLLSWEMRGFRAINAEP